MTRVQANHGLIPNTLLEVIIAPQPICKIWEFTIDFLSFENLHQPMVCGFCPTEEQSEKAHSLQLIKYTLLLCDCCCLTILVSSLTSFKMIFYIMPTHQVNKHLVYHLNTLEMKFRQEGTFKVLTTLKGKLKRFWQLFASSFSADAPLFSRSSYLALHM